MVTYHGCWIGARFSSTIKDKLFRAARLRRRQLLADDSMVEENRAIQEFGLTREQLHDLPRKELFPRKASYNVSDVYKKALEIHGSERAVQQRLQLFQSYLYQGSIFDERKKKGEKMYPLEDAARAVKLALGMNFLDACFKLYGALITGSKSLASEGLHSSLDLTNQIILMYGIKWSNQNPTPSYPYGYGNARFIASLISGCWLFGFGGGISLYHGFSGLMNPRQLESPSWALGTLFLSFLLQGTSACYAWWKVRSRAKEANLSIFEYVKTSADPSLSVVCLEDSASILGTFIAASSITWSYLLQTSIPDSCGSILIGTLLGSVAAYIIRHNAMHLAGKSVPQTMINDIVARLRQESVIKSVHDVKAVGHGVGQLRFKAEVEYDGRAITNLYLSESCHVPSMIEEVRKISDEESLRRFMCHHGGQIVDRIADEVDRIEEIITKKHPDVKHVDLEPL